MEGVCALQDYMPKASQRPNFFSGQQPIQLQIAFNV